MELIDSASPPDLACPQAAAEDAGLLYVNDSDPGLQRRRAGKGFVYLRADGSRLRDAATLKRIRALAIPPAWSDVWICPSAQGHIQATGRDARGRKQYRYHAEWSATRDAAKYGRVLSFALALPTLRERVDADMRKRGLPREKVLATIVHLLETTLIRIGNMDYAKQNGSYGLTTLRDRHVQIEGAELRFDFKGKSGKLWRLSLKNRRVAKVVRACQDLPGQHLFQYLDEAGERQSVTSNDVNSYLREICGLEATAKDFRTWAGTVLAALELADRREETKTARRKTMRDAVRNVAARLGNTVAVCRKCYIHPEIFAAYEEDALLLSFDAAQDGLRPEEAATLTLLSERLTTERRG